MSVNCFFVFQHSIHYLPCAVLPNFVKAAFAPSMTGNATVCSISMTTASPSQSRRNSCTFCVCPDSSPFIHCFLAGTAVIVGNRFYVFAGLRRSSRQPSAHVVSANLGQSRKPNLFHQILRHSAAFRFIFDIRVFLPYFSDGLG